MTEGLAGGHVGADATARKMGLAGLWCGGPRSLWISEILSGLVMLVRGQGSLCTEREFGQEYSFVDIRGVSVGEKKSNKDQRLPYSFFIAQRKSSPYYNERILYNQQGLN